MVGIGILALLGIQLIIAIASSTSRFGAQRRQQALATEILQKKLDAAKRVRPAGSESSWNGWRKFTVARKILESRDVASIYLAPHDRKPLAGFNPGQFLTFNFKIPSRSAPVVR